MTITLTNTGKRFEHNWVFRSISRQFNKGGRYAVLGPNGSGKSTLLKTISGNISPTEGSISYTINGSEVNADDIYKYVSIAAPYLDVPEEYTLEEIITFHRAFKPIEKNLSTGDILALLELEHTNDKTFKYFSSGMKQRVKLGIAILSATPLLLLDEPATALDAKSVQWYQNMLKEFTGEKTIIVFSNNKPEEYGFCGDVINIPLA